MHYHKTKYGFVIAAGLLHRLVKSIGAHKSLLTLFLGNIIGVLLHKFLSRLALHGRSGNLHIENAFQNSQQNALFDLLLIVADLLSNVVHEINACRNISAEASFGPAIHT